MGKDADAAFGGAAGDLVRLDQLEPGVIARMLKAGPRLRHAIYLSLAGLGTLDGEARDEIEPELAKARLARSSAFVSVSPKWQSDPIDARAGTFSPCLQSNPQIRSTESLRLCPLVATKN